MRLSWLVLPSAQVAAAVLGFGASLVAELADQIVEIADSVERLEAQVR